MNINSIVESVSNLHSNPVNSPSQDTGLVSRDGYKIIGSLTLYIPQNISIERLLREHPPSFEYEKDCFIYILHLITSIPAGKRDVIDENDGFTLLNRKYLQKRIHGYKRYIEYLKSKGILEERRYYVPGVKSMGLKFSGRINGILEPIRITKWTLIKSIVYLHKTYNVEITNNLSYLEKWFDDSIEVEYEGAKSYLDDIYQLEIADSSVNHEMLRLNSRMLPVTKLHTRDYSFHVDNTGYRLHTNLTQMMSGLRKFITYNGKKLCAVDIKNSQPYLANVFLDIEIFERNNMINKIPNPLINTNPLFSIMVVENIRNIQNEEDVILFKQCVSGGTFYEYFGRLLVEKGLIEDMPVNNIREKAKKVTFTAIYSNNRSIGYSKEMQLFRDVFPNVFKIFKLIKKGCHEAFSISLQRLEADLVLHKSCSRISQERPEVVMYTLHDSIITTEDNVEYVKSVMYDVLKENIGIDPSLKEERWE